MAYKDKMKKRFGFIPGSKKRKSKHVEDPTDTIVSKTSHAIPRGSPKPPGSVSSSEISALEKQKAVAGKRNSWAKATAFLRYSASVNLSTNIDEQKEVARGFAEQAIQEVDYHGEINGVPTFENKDGVDLKKKLDKLQGNLETLNEEWNTRFEQSQNSYKDQLSDSLKELNKEWAART